VIDVRDPNLSGNVDFLRGRIDDAAFELSFAGALLDAVAHGRAAPTVRVYRPLPTVAFGRQDRFADGFATAAAAAESHGFTPVLRAPGGHAAAYDEDSIVIDEVMPASDSIVGIHERFAERADRQAQALRRLGIEAEVGRVPGEYCPGDFTVNAAGTKKLIGTAQRIVRGGWLFSTVVIVDGSARIRAVLKDVYAALGLDWDPRTVGAVRDEAPAVRIDEVEQALLDTCRDRYRLIAADPRPDILAAAGRALDRFVIAASRS
jgi:octanoyl-[GcvH]:protein N-octanoyltransferase